MKFQLTQNIKGYKLGQLSLALGTKTNIIETPNFLFNTTGGNHIPHLTYDNINHLKEHLSMLHFSLDQVYKLPFYHELENNMSRKLAEVSNTKEYSTLLDLHQINLRYGDIQDTQYPFKSGKNFINIKTGQGLQKVTSGDYINYINKLNPDAFISLYDYIPTGPELEVDEKNKKIKLDSTRKRQLNAILRSELFLKDITNDNKQNIVPVLLGGNHEDLRVISVHKTLQCGNFEGFLIGNFEGELKNKLEQLDVSLLELSKSNKQAFIASWEFSNPEDVINAVEHGVDLFDSSYPWLASEKGFALTFSTLETPAYIELNPITLDDVENRYTNDIEPISSTCKCYTCTKKYSKAYLVHLLNTHEMLAQILLMQHNLYHFSQFFKSIRNEIKEDNFQGFKKSFLEKYGGIKWWKFLNVNEVKSTERDL